MATLATPGMRRGRNPTAGLQGRDTWLRLGSRMPCGKPVMALKAASARLPRRVSVAAQTNKHKCTQPQRCKLCPQPPCAAEAVVEGSRRAAL